MLKVIIGKESFITIVNAGITAGNNIANLVGQVVKPFKPSKTEVISDSMKGLTAEDLWNNTPEKDLTVGARMVRTEDTVEIEYNAETIAKTIQVLGRFYGNLINPALTFGVAVLQTKVAAEQYTTEIMAVVKEANTKVDA